MSPAGLGDERCDFTHHALANCVQVLAPSANLVPSLEGSKNTADADGDSGSLPMPQSRKHLG